MEERVPLAKYLWTRIRQLGVGHVMGVPGDMNLELLDHLNEVEGLTWVGNANELNAAYAADGYARIKGCPGVVVTTMGVGELSALNGIAGAYTEQVKVIHVVGTTATSAQKSHAMIHHNLGPDPDHRVFEKISSRVRCACAWLDDIETAPQLMDQTILQCLEQSLPVYIYIPLDFITPTVSAASLRSPLVWKPSSNESVTKSVIDRICKALYTSTRRVVLVDALAARHQAGIIDETHPRFISIYSGAISSPGVQEAVESSDCVVNIGPLLADSNTGAFSRNIEAEHLISIEPFSCKIQGETFDKVHMKPVLEQLASRLDPSRLSTILNPVLPPLSSQIEPSTTKITQAWIWKKLGMLLKPHDLLVVESGTAQFGIPEARFPEKIQYITQVYYGSIGYSVGCCAGAGLAQRELQQEVNQPPGRLLLIVGDGSLQLSVQEVGTMIKTKLKPIIILINNGGYAIERAIHGPQENYNDITPWRHQSMLEFFGAPHSRESSREVSLPAEFEQVFDLPEYQSPTTIQLLEVHMDKEDIPWSLERQIQIVQARNTPAVGHHD